jgi:hypothetical protein
MAAPGTTWPVTLPICTGTATSSMAIVLPTTGLMVVAGCPLSITTDSRRPDLTKLPGSTAVYALAKLGSWGTLEGRALVGAVNGIVCKSWPAAFSTRKSPVGLASDALVVVTLTLTSAALSLTRTSALSLLGNSSDCASSMLETRAEGANAAAVTGEVGVDEAGVSVVGLLAEAQLAAVCSDPPPHATSAKAHRRAVAVFLKDMRCGGINCSLIVKK